MNKEFKLLVEDLHFAYDGFPVLRNIQLRVKAGELIGILGPNGAGKSTFLKILCGTLRNYQGRVMVDGIDLRSLSSREMAKKVAIVPQDSLLGFDFTALEVVLMGRNPYQRRFGREKVDDFRTVAESMMETKTWELRDRLFTQLSGGEKQRVVIAQALAQRSQILLLDEPTSHLDISYQIETMELVHKKSEEGITVIAVLHDINLAAQYCQKVLLLSDGEPFAYGKTEEVLTKEKIGFVYGVEVSVNRSPVTGRVYVTPISKRWRYKEALSGSRMVHLICGGNSGGELMHKLREQGFGVSAGVINVLDSDHETAQSLDIPVVSEAPFSSISESSMRQNDQLIQGADLIIVSNLFFGEGNLANLRSALRAVEEGKEVILLSTDPISSRDFTGGKATELYSHLVAKGALEVRNLDELVQKIGERSI